jgi:hypothetical protein
MNIPNWWPHGADENPPGLETRVKALETKVDGMYESMTDWVGRIRALEIQQSFTKAIGRPVRQKKSGKLKP